MNAIIDRLSIASAKRSRAFTLTELLVASAMLMFLAMILVSVFSHVAGSYQSTEARSDSFRDGRAALRLVTNELRSLVDVKETLPTGSSTTPRQRISITPGTGSNDASFEFLMRLSPRAQPKATPAEMGDICAVAYYVADMTMDPKDGKALFRCLVPGTETYTKLSGNATEFLPPSHRDANQSYAEPIANNVVRFEIKALDSELTEVPTTNTDPNAQAYLQITLTVIDTRASQVYFDPNTPESLKEKIEREQSRTFTMRQRL